MASSSALPLSAFDANIQDSGAVLLNAKILKPLDEVLRCHICFDYFTNCMITKCSHNYCSVCIRRYMTYKSQCPTCFQVATEPELQNNRLIDEILRVYKKIKETLQIPVDSKFLSDPTSSSRPVVSDNFEKLPAAEKPTQTTSKQQNLEDINASDEVSCPVCYTTVPNSRINIHLDSCLKQTEERNQRKFLPKLVYHLLSDKEIRKKLKEHGLNTGGNRQALIRRHKNFIILFNANCDSLNPKPVSELICEIERQELEERVNTSQRSTPISKKSDPSVIDKEHESYVREHKSQFNALIQDVQQRVVVQKPVKKEVDITEGTSNITDESGNVIGESTLRVGSAANFESVAVKEEFSESLLQDAYPYGHLDGAENVKTRKSALVDKKSDSDLEKTSQLPFRIKKEVPMVKMKEGSPSLLDMTTKQEFATDPSSLDDFETGKLSVNRHHKKKNARRLSTEEKSSQRKK